MKFVDEEIENWVKMEVGIGGEELRVHVENAAERGARDSKGRKAIFDGFQGLERGRAELGVFSEGFDGVDV